MSIDPNKPWKERLDRGRLDPAEAAALRREAREGAEGDWLEQELALEDALARLPRPPASSNFTAQVMQAVNRAAEPPRPSRWWPGWRALLWRPAFFWVGTAAVAWAATWQMRSRLEWRRAQDVYQVIRAAEAPSAANLPALDLLQDFDAIRLVQALND